MEYNLLVNLDKNIILFYDQYVKNQEEIILDYYHNINIAMNLVNQEAMLIYYFHNSKFLMNLVNSEVMLIDYSNKLIIVMNMVVGDRGAKSTQLGRNINLFL